MAIRAPSGVLRKVVLLLRNFKISDPRALSGVWQGEDRPARLDNVAT